MDSFGKRLRNNRKKRGLTQLELAQRMNCTKSLVSAYERNDRNPTIEMIEKFAGALGIDPLDLMEGKEKRNERHFNSKCIFSGPLYYY